MDKADFELFLFYCWQLKLRTLADVQRFKKLCSAETNAELLSSMALAYNTL